MPTQEKAETIEEIKEKFNNAQIAILTDFQGMNVAEMTELRKLFRKANVDYKVYKNTLIRIAAEQSGIIGLEKYLRGPVAIAFGKSSDLITPAKIIRDFSIRHQNLKIKAGVLNKKAIGPEEVSTLINLPPKEVLLSMVLGGLQSPVTRLLTVLQAPLRDLALVLKSIADKRGTESVS